MSFLFYVNIKASFTTNIKNRNRSSFEINVNNPSADFEFEKEEVFRRTREDLSVVVIEGVFGTIDLQSSDGDEIEIISTIGANKKQVFETLRIKETNDGRTLHYALEGDFPDNNGLIGVSYLVNVPHDMSVRLENNFGTINVQDFQGNLELESSFSTVSVENVVGSFAGDTNFSSVGLSEISGSLKLDSNFDAVQIRLLPDDRGYDFELDGLKEPYSINLPFINSETIGSIFRKRRSSEPEVLIDYNFSSISIEIAD